MKNEQPKNAGQPKTVSVAAGNYMSTDNGMPSSEEMEQAVVLAILTQSTAICEVGNRLRPEMFTNPAYCLVYRAMLALYQHEADIDMLSVEREMRRIDPEHATQLNGLAFIADGMLKVRNARFIKTYAAWVIRCWVLRQAIAGMTARMVEAREPGVDVMAWLNASRKDLEKLEEEFAVHSTTRTAAEVGDRVLAEIYDEQERRRAGEQLQSLPASTSSIIIWADFIAANCSCSPGVRRWGRRRWPFTWRWRRPGRERRFVSSAWR